MSAPGRQSFLEVPLSKSRTLSAEDKQFIARRYRIERGWHNWTDDGHHYDCVYYVQAGGPTGHVKIGRTKNMRTRLSSLQTGSPLPLVLLGTQWCVDDSAAHIEALMHEEFRHLRIPGGEWFRWHPEITCHIEERPPTREQLWMVRAL